MRPSLAQLEALLWIHRLGGFRAAARRLGVTQPALSQRIRELERAIGATVLDRRRLMPTAAGLNLLAYAERMLALAEEMNLRLGAKGPVAGLLRLGVADSFAIACLPQLLVDMGDRFPALRVEVSVDYSAELDAELQAGALDIAVLTAPRLTEAIRVEPLVEMVLRWVAPPRLLQGARCLRPADLVDVPIVTNPSPSHLFIAVRDWFATAGVAPRRLNTCNSLMAMTRLAIGGSAVSLVPPAIVRDELGAGALRILATAPAVPAYHLVVATRRDAPAHLAHAVLGVLRPIARRSSLAPRAADRR